MSREKSLHAARRVIPGAERAAAAGSTLDCLLCAPGRDWVAIDVRTGAFVRSLITTSDAPEALEGRPSAPVRLHLAPSTEPWDPSRPEAVAIDGAAAGAAPSPRARRRLLASAARSDDTGGVLGSIGLSLPYVGLAGTRPSVVLLRPSNGRVRLVGIEEPAAAFQLGDRPYSFPLGEGALSWVTSGALATVSSSVPRGRSRRQLSVELAAPVFVLVGLGRPVRGQVRKLVLGMVPVE